MEPHGHSGPTALSGRRLARWEFQLVPISTRSRRIVLAGAVALVLSTRRGQAHAILEASEPNSGDKVRAGSIALKLRFNSRIDRTRSRLTLSRSDQTKTTPPIDPDGPPDLLTSTVTLVPGAYVLRWQVLAVDGHITRGDVPFTVTEP
jgi:methionine-rich copper-binding protein CopC